MRLWGVKRLFRFSSRTQDEVRTDIRDEFAFHLDMRTDDLVREGLTRDQARRQASVEPTERQNASANLFDVLGVTPVVGRTFRPEDDGPSPSVVLLGEAVWRQRPTQLRRRARRAAADGGTGRRGAGVARKPRQSGGRVPSGRIAGEYQ